MGPLSAAIDRLAAGEVEVALFTSAHQVDNLFRVAAQMERADALRDAPGNVWTGVSITSLQDQRLRYLMQTRATVRWVSYEPMLGPADWHPYLAGGLNWLVVGGASGPD